MPNDVYSSARRQRRQATFHSFLPEGSSTEMVVQQAVDSVTTWKDFIKVFLKKFYLIHNSTDEKEPHAIQIRTKRAFLEIL